MDRVYVMQLVRSFQCGYLSRREFLQRASLVVGSTAAASLLARVGLRQRFPCRRKLWLRRLHPNRPDRWAWVKVSALWMRMSATARVMR